MISIKQVFSPLPILFFLLIISQWITLLAASTICFFLFLFLFFFLVAVHGFDELGALALNHLNFVIVAAIRAILYLNRLCFLFFLLLI